MWIDGDGWRLVEVCADDRFDNGLNSFSAEKGTLLR